MTTSLAMPAASAAAARHPARHAALVVGDAPLTIADILAVARERRPVAISDDPEVLLGIHAGRRVLRDAVSRGEAIYGVTTRFGGMADEVLEPADAALLQERALWLHATATGEPIPEGDVRAAMLIRMASLVRGASGARLEVIERLADALNLGITPEVLEYGSIGASGDLVPLSYIAGAITGHAARYHVHVSGERVPAGEALGRVGLAPLPLEAKEALALVNGTSASTAIAAGCIHDAQRLLAIALGIHALAAQALSASVQPYHPFVQRHKPHPGQRLAAAQMLALLSGSRLVRDEPAQGRAHERGTLIQDRYSLRCLPQFLGPTLDALAVATRQVETEANSTTDNPLVDADSESFYHGGNFLGQYVSAAMDSLRQQLGLVAKHLDVQLALLVTPAFSGGLAGSLAGNTASPVNMGLKGMQLTANSLLPMLEFHGAPIADRFPTHAEQYNQNLNSQSWNSARLTWRSLRLLEHYLAVALPMAVQAVELRAYAARGTHDATALLSPGTRTLYLAVHECAGRPPRADRPLVWNDDEQRLDTWMAAVRAALTDGGSVAAAMERVTRSIREHQA